MGINLSNQAGIERERRLHALEREIIATIPPEAMAVLSRAFSVCHSRDGAFHWARWIGTVLACPVDGQELETLHNATLAEFGA
jgi:hypothetical protein